MEGGAVGAAAVGFARLRPRRARVRREPIDVELLTAELAEPPTRTELEIVAALEVEVRRMHEARAATQPEPVPAPDPAVPEVRSDRRTERTSHQASTSTGGSAIDPPTAGLPLEQVRAWLEKVKGDLRKVQARVEYLQFEQTRLQGQHHLVTELISSTTVV